MFGRLLGMVCILAAVSWPIHAAATDWSMVTLDGKRLTLSELHGKWVLVNFWAPWCSGCMEEMPDLDALQKRNPDLIVIGVAEMFSERADIEKAMRKNRVAFPVVQDDGTLMDQFENVDAVPTTFLFSPAGKLIARAEGPVTLMGVESVMRNSKK